MRTNIEIDDKLMKAALEATGAKTKREAVELGLKTLIQLRAQEMARKLRGKITWQGDLDAMRIDRGSWSTPASGSTTSAALTPRKWHCWTRCWVEAHWLLGT
ncbi:MAG: type II toxin-antitoxin system VapB family antitoxin [Burkholderiaceae bacterium]|nr:type II toxin-antitoxin system VapB family antitoxin [Burkholderiaceae bacterium]